MNAAPYQNHAHRHAPPHRKPQEASAACVKQNASFLIIHCFESPGSLRHLGLHRTPRGEGSGEGSPVKSSAVMWPEPRSTIPEALSQPSSMARA